MDSIAFWDKVAISVRSRKILQTLLSENPVLEKIVRNAKNVNEVQVAVKNWILPILKRNSAAELFYKNNKQEIGLADKLNWQDLAAIRILDYIDHAGDEYPDLNIGGNLAITNPFKMLWLAANNGTGGAKSAFFNDMLQLFRQFEGLQFRRIGQAIHHVGDAALLQCLGDGFPSVLNQLNRPSFIDATGSHLVVGE